MLAALGVAASLVLAPAGASALAVAPSAAAERLAAAQAAAAKGDQAGARAQLEALERLVATPGNDPASRLRFETEAAETFVDIGDIQAGVQLAQDMANRVAATDPAAGADGLNALGVRLLGQSRPEEAARLFDRAAALLPEADATPTRRTALLLNRGQADVQLGHLDRAADEFARAAQLARGDRSLEVAAALAQAQLSIRKGEMKAARDQLGPVVAAAAPGVPRAQADLLLATVQFETGFLLEAAAAGQEVVEELTNAGQAQSPALAQAYHLLGVVHSELQDRQPARRYLDQAIAMRTSLFGATAVPTRASQLELAWVDLQDGQVDAAAGAAEAISTETAADATPAERRTHAIALIVDGLAAEGRHDDRSADAKMAAGEALIERDFGPRTPDLGFSLVRRGRLLTRLKRYPEAKALLDRAVGIYEGVGSGGTTRLADALGARADVLDALGEKGRALSDSRRAYALLHQRFATTGLLDGGLGAQQRQGARDLLAGHATRIIASYAQSKALMNEAFAATQEATTSRAGDALRLSAARWSSIGDGRGDLVRRRLDLQEQLRRAEADEQAILLSADHRQLAESSERIRALTAQLSTLDASARSQYPALSAYLQPTPAAIDDVRAALAPDEALIYVLPARLGTVLWVVTPSGARAVADAHGDADIRALVDRLREATDFARLAPRQGLPVFPREAAKQLYGLTLSHAAPELAAARKLIWVTDGPLQTISPYLLVDPASDRWLVQDRAVTIFPTVSSFVLSRERRQATGRPERFLGVGDPQFERFMDPSAARRRGLQRDLRQALAGLPALPETATEVQTMAALFPTTARTLLLGAAASESQVQHVADSTYGTIAFATHAIMGGEAPGLNEPAIILTPSAQGDDDGLLSASEIATMKLDADLVILSACNTAAPDAGASADGFSGLARAFIVAGSRALLVSNWEVDSDATVLLTTGFLRAVTAEPGAGKAEALRTSILNVLAAGGRAASHPAFWAPFVLVGE